MITYSFLFFGPGLPLGFNNPSACADVFFAPPFPFLTTPSAGGGMAIESSVPLGAGVFAFDPDAFSAGEFVEAGSVCDVVDEAGFDSEYIPTTASNSDLILGDIFNVTIRDFLLDGRALPVVDGEALVVPAMAMVMLRSRCCGLNWCRGQTMPRTSLNQRYDDSDGLDCLEWASSMVVTAERW
jgi:hypothetical protein